MIAKGALGAFAVLGALVAADVAAAQAVPAPSLAPAEMSGAMHHYFDGEWAEGWVFLGAGVAAAGAGTALLLLDDDLALGAAIPVLAIGAIQLAAGLMLLFRTSGQVADLDRTLASDARRFQREEHERMDQVRLEFDFLMATEVMLAVVGGVMTAAGLLHDEQAFAGVGIGLAVQSVAMLLLDLFAGRRADAYLRALRAFRP